MGRRKVSRKQEMKEEAGDSIASAFGARSGTVLCPWNEESRGWHPLEDTEILSAQNSGTNASSHHLKTLSPPELQLEKTCLPPA